MIESTTSRSIMRATAVATKGASPVASPSVVPLTPSPVERDSPTLRALTGRSGVLCSRAGVRPDDSSMLAHPRRFHHPPQRRQRGSSPLPRYRPVAVRASGGRQDQGCASSHAVKLHLGASEILAEGTRNVRPNGIVPRHSCSPNRGSYASGQPSIRTRWDVERADAKRERRDRWSAWRA